MGFEFDLCRGEFADDDVWFSSSEQNPELALPIPEDEWDDTVVTGASTPQFNGPYSRKFKPHSKRRPLCRRLPLCQWQLFR